MRVHHVLPVLTCSASRLSQMPLRLSAFEDTDWYLTARFGDHVSSSGGVAEQRGHSSTYENLTCPQYLAGIQALGLLVPRSPPAFLYTHQSPINIDDKPSILCSFLFDRQGSLIWRYLGVLPCCCFQGVNFSWQLGIDCLKKLIEMCFVAARYCGRRT